MDFVLSLWQSVPYWLQMTVMSLSKIAVIVIPLLISVAYLTFAERKLIGYMQVRLGPNRVGPRGWLQPIADALKLLFKEIVVPTKANKWLFAVAPVLAIAPAFIAWAVVPFTDTLVLANIDASLLFVLAITSMGVYGVVVAGWASNSKYAFLGSLRSAAQIVAYEIAMGFALVGYSFPSFFIGLLIVFFVQIKWGLIGFDGYVPIYENPVKWFEGLILPWITLALLFAAFYARLTRNQMLETLGEDYIRTARSKGLAERRVIGKHALRAGLTPIVTAAGLDLATLLGGAVITEQIFGLNGIGKLAIQAVTTDLDLPIITGTVLVAATLVIVANLVVDILYAVIDPRVRLT